MRRTGVGRTLRWCAAPTLVWALTMGIVGAQQPGEITNVGFVGPITVEWDANELFDGYNVYRGAISDLAAGTPARCRIFGLTDPTADLPGAAVPGEGYFYLVTGERQGKDGTAGLASSGDPRATMGACIPLMRNHILDRLGYGWGEWSEERIETLGLDGYIAEQLTPSTIDESTNVELNALLAPIDPPGDIFHLIQQRMIRAVYARRQLEQQVAAFWFNHFNTDWAKIAMIFQGVFPPCEAPGVPVACDPDYPEKAYRTASELQYDDVERYRSFGFNGTFREMIEDASVSLAMIIYLDTYLSIVDAPNENFPRELMELHSMGVDCGYTQTDVEELSRAITGWSGCKKTLDDADDPTAPCIPEYWLDDPPGKWVAAFVPQWHDCTSKSLFVGTDYETHIPSTCSDPALGVNDLAIALDAIAGHPCTVDFISRKILQRFVTDEPDQGLVDELIAVWNDPGNPNGVGDMGAVLTAALTSETFLDPDTTGSKIKTPLEFLASTLRATRGTTDGVTTVLTYLVSMGHIPHYNAVPTGWPEDGASWLGTNNTLDRQNFGFALFASSSPVFMADPIGLMHDNGVVTTPGHAADIVDFYSDVLFGKALTPAERQAAIDYLDTDDFGDPADYDEARVLETIAAMLGYPQFQEQ